MMADLYEELCVEQKSIEKLDQAKSIVEQCTPDELKDYWHTEIQLKYATIRSEFYRKKNVNEHL